MSGRLEGKVAIVTGGASGLGRAVVERFVAEGASVVIADIDDAGAGDLARALGDKAAWVHCDHTRTDDCAGAVAFTLDRFGKLDILHNNAGGPFTGAFADIDDETLDRVIGLNLMGSLKMTRAALPALERQAAASPAGACLLYTSSLQGLKAKPNFSLYTVAKHGLVGLVRSLALELAPKNIRVNAVCPTVTETPMLQHFLSGVASDREEAMARLRATIPLGRMPEPQDTANALLFLASDEARMLTGVALPVDGGQMAM
ncbi:SDR family NAD(P)-dependent oxidoreductase [Futiania mangrovi]|uniref:SDR family oxidoreductase n=1 Tax=Futiania mangrovi TaxID=2959716 RepID=A0A9J6PEJ8_9PROT|nr:SDR family oxidoreductase [Futiania mangrovii]MCP1337113.1 SDR family oxidoreductase [Futiania mangrovii]